MPHRGKQLAHAERQRRHSSAARPPAGTKHERDLFAGSVKSECAQGAEQRGAKHRTDPQRGRLNRAARHGGRTHPRRPHRRPSKMHPRNGFPAGHCQRSGRRRRGGRYRKDERHRQGGRLRRNERCQQTGRHRQSEGLRQAWHHRQTGIRRRGEHLRQSQRRQQTEHPWQTGNLRQPLPWTTASRRHRENAFPRMTPWDLPRKAEACAPTFAYSPATSIEVPHAPQYLAARLDSTISGYRTPCSSSQLRSRSLEVTAASPIASACVRLQGS